MAKNNTEESVAAEGNGYVPRLKTRYREEVLPKLCKEFVIDNVMAAPRIDKV